MFTSCQKYLLPGYYFKIMAKTLDDNTHIIKYWAIFWIYYSMLVIYLNEFIYFSPFDYLKDKITYKFWYLK
jgi:hypothetical protein